MEESTQRRERLKAMRMEASLEAYNEHSSGVKLSNPLVESTEAQLHSSAQSFNYYTDPMAAFSGNSKSKVSPHDYSSSSQTSSPSFQPHISPRMQHQQPQGQQYANANYAYTPNPPPGQQFANSNYAYTPNAPPRGNIPSPSWNNNSPGPHFTSGPGRGSGQGGYPSPHLNYGSGRGSGRGYPSPGPGPQPNHGWRPNQGRGQWSGGGRGGGRGGSHNHVTAEERPDFFYNKSMVEDPWKFLEPVVWKSHNKQWLPHSLTVKKPRVSESSTHQQQSSSQPSLAEILAASFSDAANDDQPNAE